MTELFDREAPPGVRFLTAWLSALDGGCGAEREPTVDPLPFTLIQRYDGGEDLITDRGYYQLDHLAKAVDGKTAFTACEDYSRLVRRRLLYLQDHKWTEVDVPGWGLATADKIHIFESHHPEPYVDPQIKRRVARLYLDLRLVTV